MENIDKKIEETLKSFEGIKTAQAPDNLYALVKEEIQKKNSK